MADSVETFSIPQSITPEDVNKIIAAAGAPRITIQLDVESIASRLNHLGYERKFERSNNPKYQAYKKRRKDIEAAYILLEKNLSVKIGYEQSNLQKYPDSTRCNLVLPKYERLRSALEDTRENFVHGYTRQRGQRGASAVPPRDTYQIFRSLREAYAKTLKDSILYEIIKNCFEKIGIVVTRDAIRKAIGTAQKQRAAELAEFRRTRLTRLVDPGK